MDDLSMRVPPKSSAPSADALLSKHAAHWRHRDRSEKIIPFSEQEDPWIAFRTCRAIRLAATRRATCGP